ncbi:hypothetical protein LINPERHAP2_LOCUS29182, partial [Linum perenne]
MSCFAKETDINLQTLKKPKSRRALFTSSNSHPHRRRTTTICIYLSTKMMIH